MEARARDDKVCGERIYDCIVCRIFIRGFMHRYDKMSVIRGFDVCVF